MQPYVSVFLKVYAVYKVNVAPWPRWWYCWPHAVNGGYQHPIW
jgi:hypothetical protein